MNGKECYRLGREKLSTLDEGSSHAALLFETVFKKKPIELFDSQLDEGSVSLYFDLLQKRCSGFPVQYLIGKWPFRTLEFKVGPGVLIPRSDTECVVEKALGFLKDMDAPLIFDLCSGSGCIGISLAVEKKGSHVLCIEKSDDAFPYLKENAAMTADRVECFHSDIFEFEFSPYFGTASMVISNPPYVTCEEYLELEPELYFEPKEALVAEENGLYFYRRIAEEMKPVLRDGGILIFEVGSGQAEDVLAIMQRCGYHSTGFEKDCFGNNRTVFGIK